VPLPIVMQPVIDGLIAVIVNLRRVVDDLRPHDLSQVSLAAAIGAHARGLSSRHGIDLDLDLDGAVDVADWAARDVYRIAQEAVSNAVRHGSPDHIAIRVFRRGSNTVLEVSDDGTGFDAEEVVRGGGLAGMAERAAALGAQLQVHSRPAGGTRVELVIPPSQAPEVDPDH